MAMEAGKKQAAIEEARAWQRQEDKQIARANAKCELKSMSWALTDILDHLPNIIAIPNVDKILYKPSFVIAEGENCDTTSLRALHKEVYTYITTDKILSRLFNPSWINVETGVIPYTPKEVVYAHHYYLLIRRIGEIAEIIY